jgi:hypothetical protein
MDWIPEGLPFTRQQLAAYKAWNTIRKNKQDYSPLELQMTPHERWQKGIDDAVKKAVNEVRTGRMGEVCD